MSLLVVDLLDWKGIRSRAEGLSFELSAGQMAIVCGPVGCGKSRLLGLMAGGKGDARGSVRLNGRELLGSDAQEVAHRGVAYVPQRRGIFRDLTAVENLRLAWDLSPKERYRTWSRALSEVEKIAPQVPSLFRRYGSALSGGEQRVTAVLMAWIAGKVLLVLDEPFTGLDVQNRAWINELLLEHREGGGMAVVAVQEAGEVTCRADIGICLGLDAAPRVSCGGDRSRDLLNE